jgi:glycosyltransferase involved in cell wall biosynthesis
LGLRVLIVGWDREARSVKHEQRCKGVEVLRVQARGRYGGGLVNIPGLIAFNITLLKISLRVRPIVFYSVDLDTAFAALVARWLFSTRFMYDIADWYAHSRRVKIIAPLVEAVERWVLRHADYVFVPHEARIAQIGLEPVRWAVIYNTPEEVNLPEETISRESYFAYVGILDEDRGIRQLANAVTQVGVNLVLAGYGPLEAECRLLAEKNSLIKFLGPVPYERCLAIEGKSVAILALYNPCQPNNRLAAPNKLYEAMMLGKPIITSTGTIMSDFVKQECIGLVVGFDNPNEIAKAMRYLLEHPEEAKRMGSKARQLYEQQYNYEAQCRKLRDAYRSLISATRIR